MVPLSGRVEKRDGVLRRKEDGQIRALVRKHGRMQRVRSDNRSAASFPGLLLFLFSGLLNLTFVHRLISHSQAQRSSTRSKGFNT